MKIVELHEPQARLLMAGIVSFETSTPADPRLKTRLAQDAMIRAGCPAVTILAVMDENGKPVGGAVVSPKAKRASVRLDGLMVSEAKRGQGIGKALVREVVARHKHLTVACRRELRSYYESLGFKVWKPGQGGELIGGTTKRALKLPFIIPAPIGVE